MDRGKRIRAASGTGDNQRWLWVALFVICGAAIALRLYALERLPGINGDEAWYGVQAQRWAAGILSDWRTPTGNLPGPLHLGALRLLHLMFEPSFVLLRISSVIASLAAMGLAFHIGQRFFTRATAAAAVVLMAALPANIVYARFGWDPSDSGAVILLATWAALARRSLLTPMAFAAALAVHPTNVFAAPFVLIAFAASEWASGDRSLDRRDALGRIALVAVLMLTALSVLKLTSSRASEMTSLAGALARMIDPRQWLDFIILFGRLLDGETVFTYISGSGLGSIRPLADTAAIGAVLLTLAAGVREWRRHGITLAVGVIAGWAASLAVFFTIAGTAALQPHFERYAFVLVAPTSIAMAVALGLGVGHHLRQLALLLGALAAALLAATAVCYTARLEREGSQSHRTFWTGAREPKQAAFDHIASKLSAGPVRVMAEDWWLYWPLAYLSVGRPIEVVDVEQPPRPIVTLAPRGGTYWVAFAGGELDQQLAARGTRLSATIAGAQRPQLLRIWWVPSA